MADDLDGKQASGGAARGHGKISRKAMRRLDDDVITRILLRPDQDRREPSWWRKLFQWLTKKRRRCDNEG